MNKTVIYVCAALVIIGGGGGGIYLFTRSSDDIVPSIPAIPEAMEHTIATKRITRYQYLYNIEAAHEMQKECKTAGRKDNGEPFFVCDESAMAILNVMNWHRECYDWVEGKPKTNANTRACLDKKGLSEKG